MGVRVLEVENYRSLRRLRVDLASPTVVRGPNGSGKTNLQVVLTTHARELAEEIGRLSGVAPIVLEKRDGETVVVEQR